MRNDTEAAKRLIEQGANPCCEDQRQWSPLIWAASHGNEDLTRLLIKHNAAEVYKSDETKVRKKHSPLHWAAFKGHLKAYHEKLREFHPDKRPESRGETGGRVTQAVLDAWTVLQDAEKRKAYDIIWTKMRREQSAAEFAEARRREGNELYKEAQALSKMSGPDSLSAATAALTKYQAAIERYSEGISLAPQDAVIVVELKPDFMKGWFLLAKALWKEGNAVLAQRQLDAALQALPGCAELLALQDEMAADVQAAAGGDLLPPVQRSRSSRSVSPACTPVQGNSRSNSRVATPPPVRGASKSSTGASARHRSSSRPRHRSAQIGRRPRSLVRMPRGRLILASSTSRTLPIHSPVPAAPPAPFDRLPGRLRLHPEHPEHQQRHHRLRPATLLMDAQRGPPLLAWRPPVGLEFLEVDVPLPWHGFIVQMNHQLACRGFWEAVFFHGAEILVLMVQSLDVFCEKEITQTFVFEHPEASEKEKPVTWCNEVRTTIQELEHQLTNAMHLNQLETVTAALEAAADKPVDCKLVHQCNQLKEKLESEIQLGKAMQVTTITDLDEFDSVHDALSKAIDDAVAKKADPVRVQAAKTLRRKLLAEASLMRTVLGPQKTTVAHISMLQELLTAAKAESANEELVLQASKLIARLRSESEVQQRISATAVLCEVDCFKEAEGREEMPDWSRDTERFEEFHEDFKRVMEDAERDQISEILMNTALEQLDKIERLLVDKKQTEEEMRLKAAKASKKKGKK
ncbi:Kidins220 [Symbiodinium sp. CCMP2456]|nr:Kidins220 [Symbiodinium sp. CCMP2456]